MSWVESRKQYRKRVTLADGKSRDVWGKTKQEVRDKVRKLEKEVADGFSEHKHMTLIALVRE